MDNDKSRSESTVEVDAWIAHLEASQHPLAHPWRNDRGRKPTPKPKFPPLVQVRHMSSYRPLTLLVVVIWILIGTGLYSLSKRGHTHEQATTSEGH